MSGTHLESRRDHQPLLIDPERRTLTKRSFILTKARPNGSNKTTRKKKKKKKNRKKKKKKKKVAHNYLSHSALPACILLSDLCLNFTLISV